MHNLPHLRAPVARSPFAVAVGVAVILLLLGGLIALSTLRGETPAAPVVMAGDPVPADVLVLSPASKESGALEFSATAGWLRRGGDEVQLTATEFNLLAELAAHLGRVLSRPQLLQRVWDYDHLGDERLVDVTVRRLRLKLEPDPSNPVHLVTLRGRGYRLQAAP